jgi:hypothetical protein
MYRPAFHSFCPPVAIFQQPDNIIEQSNTHKLEMVPAPSLLPKKFQLKGA